jgi:metal transporter CNNM
MLSSKEKITPEIAKKIKIKGYSKIPVYEGSNKNQIIGFLKTKSIIDCLDRHVGKVISEVYSSQAPLIVSKDTNLLEMLMIFQDKRTTIAMVNDEERKQKKKEISSETQFYSVAKI